MLKNFKPSKSKKFSKRFWIFHAPAIVRAISGINILLTYLPNFLEHWAKPFPPTWDFYWDIYQLFLQLCVFAGPSMDKGCESLVYLPWLFHNFLFNFVKNSRFGTLSACFLANQNDACIQTIFDQMDFLFDSICFGFVLFTCLHAVFYG